MSEVRYFASRDIAIQFTSDEILSSFGKCASDEYLDKQFRGYIVVPSFSD
jgi:hypothetical protein